MARQKGRLLNLYTKDYVVFDLETTGLTPETDEIIELSGIKVRNGQAEEEFSTLINPGIPIPYAATRVNGITDSMVAGAPSLADALAGFLDFIGNDILVGHNIHTFDMNFLYDGALKALGRKVQNDYVDTLPLARCCLPSLYRYRLTDIAECFHIETAGAHRALNDCVMNRLCYEKLGEILAAQSDGASRSQAASSGPVCPQCGSPLVRRRGRYGEFFGCSGFPRCRYTQNV